MVLRYERRIIIYSIFSGKGCVYQTRATIDACPCALRFISGLTCHVHCRIVYFEYFFVVVHVHRITIIGIQDGDRRHNCDECQESYDLCDKCYSEGKGAEHKAQHGVSHDFTLERYSNMALRDRIPDERIETCFRNAFRSVNGSPQSHS